MGGRNPAVVDVLRSRCAAVARRAAHVRIAHEKIAPYAARLPVAGHAHDQDERGDRAEQAAFWLTLNAINFGSGWFPTLKKTRAVSGYFTIAGALREQFATRGPWSAAELGELSPGELAQVLGQEPDHELMGLFAASLNDLGRRLAVGYGGDFSGPVREAGTAAVVLVETLAQWDCFADTSSYGELTVPFLKRAQIAAADLARAGAAAFGDLGRLTMFADNLVPHVLRLDGILVFTPALVRRIETGEQIPHGSPEEVEIRACALHAVELITAERPSLTAAELDAHLWHRGQRPEYKAHPRHRTRCTAY